MKRPWLETKGFFISVSILDGWEELFFKSYLVCFYRDGRFWGLTGKFIAGQEGWRLDTPRGRCGDVRRDRRCRGG